MQDWNNDIERYKSGKMTSSEMHALEKKALSDPFLADALHGAEKISNEDFTKEVAALNERILSNNKKSLWAPLRIAAGIILLMGISVTIYFISTSDQRPELMASKTESKTTDSITSLGDTVSNKKDLLTMNESLEEKEKSTDEKKSKARQEVALPKLSPITKNEPPVQMADQAAETKQSEEAPEIKAEEETKPQPEVAEEQKLSATEIETQSALRDIVSDKKEVRKKVISPSSTSGALASKPVRVVNGQVTSAEDGTPLPGVNVTIKGTTKGTITDEQGNYSIELDAEKSPQLVFSFIGTYSNEVPVNDQSNVNTQLKNDVSQLSEVVVVGYGTDNGAAADDDFPTLLIAEPNGGRRAFKKYLETNLQYPQQALENKVEGKVTVQFTVTTDGMLNDFRVIKGIGSGCDDEVIRLIKEGPKWYPSRKGETAVDSRMRVRMRFKLP